MCDAPKRRAAARILRKMASGPSAGGLESALESTSAVDLQKERAHAAHEAAVEIAEREWADALDPQLLEKLEAIYLQDGVAGLERLRAEGEQADLSDAELGGLEAIVETDGSRPSLQVSAQDTIAIDDPMLRSWQGVTATFEPEIADVCASVGRVDVDGRHRGTGWVVGDGLILTNRHVLQQIADQGAGGAWSFKGRATVTFDADPRASRDREFVLAEVVAAGPAAIDLQGPLDFTKLDFALLRCTSRDDVAFPRARTLEQEKHRIVTTRPVYTVGYPARPGPGEYKFSVLQLLFKNLYGVKRFAPGEIDLGLGTEGETVFAHDATTLGGNSGSCVVDLGDDGLSVAGLHFAGFKANANYAHSIAMLLPTLAEHLAPDA